MKSHTTYLTFNIPARMGFENITPQIEAIVKESGVQEGLLLCNAMHITASVFINDDEAGLHEDYKKWLEGLAPFDASPQRYAHNRTGEDNRLSSPDRPGSPDFPGSKFLIRTHCSFVSA